MLPLFDMFTRNGEAMETLARRFGLSLQQTQAAVEALLPAFSQGLKRGTADPYGLGAFFQALAAAQQLPYFTQPQAAFTPRGMEDGNALLGWMFGSEELSRAVAQHAARASGVSQDILLQMQPALAAMMMGGLAAQARGQQAAASPLGDLFTRFMQASPPQASSADKRSHFDAGWVDVFGGLFPPTRPQKAAPTDPAAAWTQLFDAMLGSTPEPEPPTNPSGRARNPYDDLFEGMFETGRQQRDDYQKSMEALFDQMLGGSRK